MKSRSLSSHIWKAIEAQACTVKESLSGNNSQYLKDNDIEVTNEFELKRLRILIRQLEEESPIK